MTERPKILIVDDEALMGLLYQKHIENAGYAFASAKSAEEGLELVAKEKPALIVLDVILPTTDGLAALRRLKGTPATKDIPVIVITTASLNEHYATLKEAIASGAATFLTKPFGPDKLVAEIKRLVPV
jgi:CheY-like chemotaxis protein